MIPNITSHVLIYTAHGLTSQGFKYTRENKLRAKPLDQWGNDRNSGKAAFHAIKH